MVGWRKPSRRGSSILATASPRPRPVRLRRLAGPFQGVAAAIAKNGSFTYIPLDYQNIFGLQGSNPNLKPEDSTTKTFGFVVTPTALPGFAVTVDYFDINVKGAVASINFQTSINNCIATGTDTFCNNVIRSNASGKITELLQLNLNVGSTSVPRASTPRSATSLIWAGSVSWIHS